LVLVDGFDALFKPGGFEAGSKPVRNEFGQDIRLYQIGVRMGERVAFLY